MVDVRPFKAIRPKPALAQKIAALPYDVLNSKEAKHLAEGNPYSFFHIDKAEIDLHPDISPYDSSVYQKAAENLQKFLENGWLNKEDKPIYYLYELTMEGRSQTGLVSCASLDDYAKGNIKKHEYTRPEKEIDRINHMETCDAHTSPIFLTYRRNKRIQELIQQAKESVPPVYDFLSYHHVHHKIWLIEDHQKIIQLEKLFKEVPALYIADGHHRTESAVKVGIKKREEGKNNKETECFLSVIFPENELSIWEYNRVVKETLPKDFWKQLEENFEIKTISEKKPKVQGQFQMYVKGKWHEFKIKQEKIPADSVGKLDVSLLQKYILEKIFNIKDIRTDKRVDFVGGIRGTDELERLVDSGEWKLAFSMYPTSIHDLLDVADDNKVMPPKSTWFEPKLLSGLFLHDLETR